MAIPAIWCGPTRTQPTPTPLGRRINRTCGTTRLPGWSTPASTYGLLPYYGPFGDIKDTVACEDQFRNAYLLGCVGAWSLHPVQIEIAKRVFSPTPGRCRPRSTVIDAMGDGTGAIMLDGKMEDDASVKQCKVMVELARQLAERDPELAALYGFDDRETARPPRLAVRCCTCRRANERALEKAKALPADALIFDLEDAVAPDAKDAARDAACAAASHRATTATANSRSAATASTPQWGAADLAAIAAPAAAAVVVPKVNSVAYLDEVSTRARRRRRTGRRPSGRWSRRRPRSSTQGHRCPPSGSVLVMGTNDLARELHAACARPAAAGPTWRLRARRRAKPARRSSTASTTT